MFADEKKKKEPILAAVLNFLTGGGGYLYIGQTTKGIVFIAGEVIVLMLICVLMFATSAMGLGFSLPGACGTALPLPFWWLIAAGAAFDGFRLAQGINEGHVPGQWEFFWGRK